MAGSLLCTCVHLLRPSLLSQNTPLQVHTYNVLLHLCSGGNQQGEAATRVHPAEASEVCCSLIIYLDGGARLAFLKIVVISLLIWLARSRFTSICSKSR